MANDALAPRCVEIGTVLRVSPSRPYWKPADRVLSSGSLSLEEADASLLRTAGFHPTVYDPLTAFSARRTRDSLALDR